MPSARLFRILEGSIVRRPKNRPEKPERALPSGTKVVLDSPVRSNRLQGTGVMAGPSRLGELLVREKLISLQQLRKAQDEQKRSGQNLGFTLAKLGFISDNEITNFLSSQYRL